ncbi:VTC4 [Scenedesmus sp. PABB004]|nr:VTC4 [Scenedesmus sp. PABB004]
MKFGKYLEKQAKEEWRAFYLDYKGLKDLIKESAKEAETSGPAAFSPRTTSLSIVRAAKTTDAAEERFFQMLEAEVEKVGKFTQRVVAELRQRLANLAPKADRAAASGNDAERETLMEEAKVIGEDYLALEKYANLNYMGVHKILKKHDKLLPHAPCRQFYIAHLHQQPWVQGTYSDVLVHLSNAYSQLRGDPTGTKNEDASQGFVRSTTKYWVRAEDVSNVKYHILQHLPVFQFDKDDFSGDAQLINSVYFDNENLELYHGRLDKKPNAIALRIRWYGPGEPKKVFIERKTHREGWKGEESVKERFTLDESKVVPFLEMEYGLDQAVADLRAAGKSDGEIEKFTALFTEVRQQIDSKQLRPFIRTQYMRTAFQIPFDSTVRVSMDTNLCMIKENPDDGPSCTLAGRWYRDPSLPINRNEITRFPHAVLEVKLSLGQGQEAPAWVQELLESGYLTEVHKFSKFIHGSCTLTPELVQAVPYWVDDESVRPSMLLSAPPAGAAGAAGASSSAPGQHVAVEVEEMATPAADKPRKRAPGLDDLTHPLLGDQPTLKLLPDPSKIRGFVKRGFGGGGQEGPGFLMRLLGPSAKPAAMAGTMMRAEPKTFFANERTYLSWLHMAVTLGSIAAALLGFSSSGGKGLSGHLVEIIALLLLPVAIGMCGYAIFIFKWRSDMIAKKRPQHFDDRLGPLGLCAAVVAALFAILVVSFVDFLEFIEASKAGPSPAPGPAPAPAPAPSPAALAAALGRAADAAAALVHTRHVGTLTGWQLLANKVAGGEDAGAGPSSRAGPDQGPGAAPPPARRLQQHGRSGSSCSSMSDDSGPAAAGVTPRPHQWLYKEYKIQDEIGSGGFGRVCRARRLTDGKVVVVKEIKTTSLSAKQKSATMDEVEVLAKLNHPNIVKYHDCFMDDVYINIVMEYCNGGDLSGLLKRRAGALLPEAEVMSLFVQICLALQYVHAAGVLHRDLKSSNVLITSSPAFGGMPLLKLGDFGVAKISGAESSMASTIVGTPQYLSPEMCDNKPYGKKSDVWALGCILYELASLTKAFDLGNGGISGIILKIMRGAYAPLPAGCSPQLCGLVAELLQTDPAARPSVAEILAMPYVREHLTAYCDWARGVPEAHPEVLLASLGDAFRLARAPGAGAGGLARMSAPRPAPGSSPRGAAPTPPAHSPHASLDGGGGSGTPLLSPSVYAAAAAAAGMTTKGGAGAPRGKPAGGGDGSSGSLSGAEAPGGGARGSAGAVQPEAPFCSPSPQLQPSQQQQQLPQPHAQELPAQGQSLQRAPGGSSGSNGSCTTGLWTGGQQSAAGGPPSPRAASASSSGKAAAAPISGSGGSGASAGAPSSAACGKLSLAQEQMEGLRRLRGLKARLQVPSPGEGSGGVLPSAALSSGHPLTPDKAREPQAPAAAAGLATLMSLDSDAAAHSAHHHHHH